MLTHTVEKLDRRVYRHTLTYAAFEGSRFPQSVVFRTYNAKLSKHEKRNAMLGICPRTRRPVINPILYKMGQAYSPKYWTMKRTELTVRRATVNGARSILHCSKRDARARKIMVARDYEADGLTVTVPMFKAYDLDRWQEKRIAYRQAKYTKSYPATVWFDVVTEDEDTYETDSLGEFKRNWEPGAVNHYARQHGRDGEDNHTCKWYLPPITYREHYDGLQETGYSKADADLMARGYVLADYERALTYGDSWSYVYVTVNAYIDDQLVGSASGGMVESDCVDSVLDDLKQEAVDQIDPALLATE